MKIAQLIAQFYPYVGGAEVCVHNICDSLSRHGHEAIVVTTTPPPEDPPELPYEVLYLSPRTCGLLRKAPWLGKIYLHYELARLQKKQKFDLWQVTMGYPLGTYAAPFFAGRVPAVLRCCGQDIQTLPELAYGYRLDPSIDSLARKTYPLYAGFVANSPTMKEEYLQLGIPESSIEVIPNGVQLSLFAETAPDIELKKSLCAGRDVPLILTSGRYHEKKGFHLIPQMARLLREMGLDFIWLVAGRGNKKILELCPEAESLGIRVLEKVGAAGKKGFALPSREMIALYKAADIFAWGIFRKYERADTQWYNCFKARNYLFF